MGTSRRALTCINFANVFLSQLPGDLDCALASPIQATHPLQAAMAESPQPENDILPPWGCNICFEDSREPVCTTCGHLFCWPCLHAWVHDMAKQACPVCRAPVTLEANVVRVHFETRAEPSQGAAAPASSTTHAAPSATAQSSITPAETQTEVPRGDLNRMQLLRERLSRVQEEQADERATIARGVAQNEEHLSSLETDYQSLSGVSRELMRRRNAASSVSQA